MDNWFPGVVRGQADGGCPALLSLSYCWAQREEGERW